jgi:putative membrane protein
MRFIAKIVVTALALWATTILPGISLDGSSFWVNVGTLVAVAIIFGVVNAIIKPIIKTLGCAFYVLTLGLIALVVNALLFLLTGWLAGLLHLPFTVDGFWSALFGAIIVAVVSFVLHLIIPDSIDEE